MGRLLYFPRKLTLPEDAMPLTTMCVCGVELGLHSHVGLRCPIYLGREVASYSRVLTFTKAVNQGEGA